MLALVWVSLVLNPLFQVDGFGQVLINIFPDTSAGEIQTNRNAQTAAPESAGAGLVVAGSLLAASQLTATTLRIAYPGPITSQPVEVGQGACIDGNNNFVCPNGATAGIPAGDPLRIEGASGLFLGVGNLRLNTTRPEFKLHYRMLAERFQEDVPRQTRVPVFSESWGFALMLTVRPVLKRSPQV